MTEGEAVDKVGTAAEADSSSTAQGDAEKAMATSAPSDAALPPDDTATADITEMRAPSLDGVEPFKLPERSTRGRRMKELLGDEIEADDLFWSADLWNEDAEDAEFSEAESSEDEVDADFDAPEEEFEPAEEDVPEKTKPKKNKNAYVDPALKKHAKKKTTVTSEPVEDLDHQKDGSNDDEKPEKRETKKRRTNQASAKIDSPPLSPRIFRQSTVDSTERTRQRDIVSKGKKKRKTKLKSKGPRQMTQEDLLAEAKITEELNMESLKVMLKNFEEKKKQTVKKQKAPGPHTTFHSYTVTDPETGERFCKNEISFSDPSVIPTDLCPSTGISPHQKEPFLCAVPACGKPAKYRDPLTGKGYHSVECFRAIRAMHLRNEEKSYTKRIAMLQNLLSNKMKKKAELLARNPALSVATSSTSLSTAPPLSQQQQQQQQPTPSNPLTNSTPITSSTTLVVTTNAPAQAPAQANTQTTMTTAPPAVLGAPLLYPGSPSVFAPPRL